MTDQTIPADDLRRFIARYRTAANDRGSILLDELEALLPHPTLADMSPEERAACQWMQADVKPGGRLVITAPNATHARAALLDEGGEVTYQYHANITPRPDLPRLEWPSDKTAPTGHALPDGFRLAEHPDYGRVIVTTPDPGCDGDAYFVYPETVLSLGFNSDWCDSAALTFLDGPATHTPAPVEADQ